MAHFKGTKHNDDFTGTKNADTFNLSQGGDDRASGGKGNDTFVFGAKFTAKDQIDGGAGQDTLTLNGNYAGSHKVVFGAKTMVGVETIALAAGHDYALTTNSANVASGATLTVDGSKLGAGDVLTFNGSHETNGKFHITGGKGNDVLTGGGKSDFFDLTKGGNDHANGGGGDDIFNLGAKFDENDSIKGGGGNDLLKLDGDYTGAHALTITHSMISAIGEIGLTGGSGQAYDITIGNDLNIVNLTIGDFGTVAGLTFNGSAETTGSFTIDGSSGDDTLTGGQQGDVFVFSFGGHDAVFDPDDVIDGQGGSDTLQLNGDYSSQLVFTSTMMQNVEKVQVVDGHSYNLAIGGGGVVPNGTFTVDASGLTGTNNLTFDFSPDHSGLTSYTVTGGAGNDSLTMNGYSTSPAFHGGQGIDTLYVNGESGGDDITVGTANITGLNALQFVHGSAGRDFHFTESNANVSSGDTLSVDLQYVDGSDTATFDGSAETNGNFAFFLGVAAHNDLTGGQGGDAFYVNDGAGSLSNSTLDGGAGSDALIFPGTSGGFDSGFALTQITSVESVQLFGGFSYSLTIGDANFSETGTMSFFAVLDAAHTFSLDASSLTGSKGVSFAGGAGSDSLAIGDETVMALTTMDGGAGSDTLYLHGDFTSTAFTFGASALTSVEAIHLDDVGSYNLTTVNANVASGQTLTVDGSGLTASNELTFNGSAETNGHFLISGGASDDTLQGGGLADSMTGGTGEDTFVFEGNSVSTSANYDHITDFDASTDVIELSFTVAGASNTPLNGSVSTATFDSDLGTILAGNVSQHSAVLVHANGGDLTGDTFLVIDANNNLAYDGGVDYVINVTGMTGTLSVNSFISG